jgi:hypothetical protein
MNGMRKVGHKSASRQGALDESEELDFNQDLEDDMEENKSKEHIEINKDSINLEILSKKT